jgi:hypothetical protein
MPRICWSQLEFPAGSTLFQVAISEYNELRCRVTSSLKIKRDIAITRNTMAPKHSPKEEFEHQEEKEMAKTGMLNSFLKMPIYCAC